MKLRSACVLVGLLSLALSLAPATFAQTSAETASALPRLVRFAGTAKDINSNPLTGVVGITFALYSEQTGGAALWLETQNVTADSNGRYVALLGATNPDGLPTELFTSEQARWVGVEVSGQPEQPRVLLVSAPYALKAGDAETIGGLPPSAFVLAAPVSSNGSSANNGATPTSASVSAIAKTSSDVTTNGGTVNAVPLFTTATNIQNSILKQTGTTAVSVAGKLNLPATGTATAAGGKNSQPQTFVASSFNSSTSTAENQTFQWQAEPASNDSTTPSGTLNLLYGLGATTPSETGLKLSSTGKFTFATGQTFPGTGTITGITTASGSGLAGGGTTGTLSLSVPSAGITNTMLKNSTVTLSANTAGGITTPGAMTLGSTYAIGLQPCSANQVLQYVGTAWTCSNAGAGTVTGVTAGTDLTGGGTSGTVTLNLDTTKVPQLVAANTFTGNQTVNGNLSATGVVTGSSFQIGSNLFAYGSYGNGNAFLGFAGNTTMTGTANTASGYQALFNNTTGASNAASGFHALFSNTSGVGNTATGSNALFYNNTGYDNTAAGSNALQDNTTGYGNTATGDIALVSNTTGSNNTASGAVTMYSNTTGNNNTASGSYALYSNITGSNNDAFGYAALQFNTGSPNDAFGYQALNANTTGSNNVASGYETLIQNTTGNSNTANGSTALYSNTTGDGNTASGLNALYANTTGKLNTAGGYYALFYNTTGSFNTALGYYAGPDSSTPALTNSTAIGAWADVLQSNALVLGSTAAQNSSANVFVGIDVGNPSNILTVLQGGGPAIADGWSVYSSRRWKTNIQTLHGALEKVVQLRGVSYELKETGKHEVGVIAEEVGAVVPEVVSYEENGKDARGVDYSRLTALLIEATKEQQALIHKQQEQIKVQRMQIQAQRRRGDAQQAQIARLTQQVKTIQTALKANGRSGSEIRTVRAEGTTARH